MASRELFHQIEARLQAFLSQDRTELEALAPMYDGWSFSPFLHGLVHSEGDSYTLIAKQNDQVWLSLYQVENPRDKIIIEGPFLEIILELAEFLPALTNLSLFLATVLDEASDSLAED